MSLAETLADCPLCALRDARGPGFVAELDAGVLVVDPVQRYPGKATLVMRQHVPVGDMLDLPDTTLLALHADVVRAARAVRAATGAAWVNLALFANLAPHVHWHLVPRFDDGDASPPDLTPGAGSARRRPAGPGGRAARGAGAMSEPLLLLPGMMCDERLFAAQAAALDGAVAWKALREETIEDMADAVLARAPDRFALAGLSMGGIVAMEIAGRAPERVARLALLDTNHLPEAPERRAARAPQIEAALEGKLETIMAEEMKPAYLAPNHPRTSEILALVRDMALGLGPEVFRAQSLALRDRQDQTKTLQGLTMPTLLLVGAHDRLCPAETARGDARAHSPRRSRRRAGRGPPHAARGAGDGHAGATGMAGRGAVGGGLEPVEGAGEHLDDHAADQTRGDDEDKRNRCPDEGIFDGRRAARAAGEGEELARLANGSGSSRGLEAVHVYGLQLGVRRGPYGDCADMPSPHRP